MKISSNLRKRLLFVSVLGCLSFMPSPLRSAEPKGEDVSPYKVEIYAWQVNDGEKRFINKGDSLKSGEQFQLVVKPEIPIFIRVIYTNTAGDLAIYPSKGESPIAAREEAIVPDKALQFELDKNIGREDVYVITSSSKIDLVDRDLNKIIKKVEAAAATKDPKSMLKVEPGSEVKPKDSVKSPKKGRTSPPRSGAGETQASAAVEIVAMNERGVPGPRGLNIEGLHSASGIVVAADSDGIIIHRFWIEHIAP